MKRIFYFVVAFWVVIIFAQSADSQTKPVQKTKVAQKQISMPKVSEFGVYTFGRHSDKSDSSGMRLPPYKHGEIVNIFFNFKSKLKEKVTVVPLQAGLATFDVEITKVEKSEFLDCNVDPADYALDVELEKITDKKWLEIEPIPKRGGEYPFDVFLIYPSVSFAKRIEPNQLKKSMLPKNVYLNTVTGAIDLTDDGKPDLLETRFCRSDKKLSPENCDYTTGQIFKIVKGVWKSVKYISSCT